MTIRRGHPARTGLILCVVLVLAALAPLTSRAAPYAAMVVDARSGEVFHAENADTQLHPASLTKMMTLWIAFEAVERGEIGLDDVITIPREAAAEPPSELGLQTGQQIRFRYLIRAAAVKSANDAATAIAFAVAGSEEAFAARMNRTARAMGMTSTNFKNAHGLTEVGHMSTARDMTLLGRHMIYDWPQYYNLFSRRSTDAGLRTVSNTNRRFLDAYSGADGIKTGYTRAAGSNLVASAQRGTERIVVTVFGAPGSAARNQRVAELMDLGFSRAPTQVALRRPERPTYLGPVAGAHTVRVSGAVSSSLRPTARPLRALPPDVNADLIAAAVEAAVSAPSAEEAVSAALDQASQAAPASLTIAPQARPEDVVMAAAEPTPEREVVERLSTSSSRHWGINVGRYNSRYQAERVLLRVALNEMSTLDGSLRRVVQNPRGFDANFMGLTRETADLACRRLQARGTTCFMVQPPS
ncbi:D-alanyl-D-alanine carboxypeptidase family protein [Histidinibacterium aquaticum]|uniref:D-alanyl-D-alanine carboxypeptidase n=1 Tax=Histidinibacterium aquaticum TaxID=2613962 RepID=A0A5J5GAW6_9RHOB|nr:D-alanyl-D-alanine carboxypeptidase family protein [Histidinibacterium aquaticum]KAA9005256.1 D-alanyl-D-alanine carboxypeptidase [Histidinibacterium aquaticum]